MKRLYLNGLLLLLLSSCGTWPRFSKESKTVFNEVGNEKETAVFMGKMDTVCSNDFCIHYESIGEISNPTILLIMGFGAPGIAWTKHFIQPLLDANYHVIRFDNRDTGRSGHAENWSKKNFYTLNDMAGDAVSILDKLQIESAHLVGVSMGGMIGQEAAIYFSDRVLTLTSIMSTADFFDKKLKSVSFPTFWHSLLSRVVYGARPVRLKKLVKKRTRTFTYLQNRKVVPDEMIRRSIRWVNFCQQENYAGNNVVDKHHARAIRKSPPRLEQLKALKIPVLLLHGKKDKLIYPEHSQKMATALPDSKLVFIDEMGHIPTVEEEQKMAEEVIDFLKRKF